MTKHPSMGNSDPIEKHEPQAAGADHPAGLGTTRTSVAGEASPRLPHERDESKTTGELAPGQTKQMRVAHDDTESMKEPTDRSMESDAAYSNLRGEIPR